MTSQPKHHITKDGSSTLYSNTFNQYYHNPNGSVSESKHVFFEVPQVVKSLETQDSVTFFETGFGTGLNFLLLLDYYLTSDSSSKVNFYSVEAFPVSLEQAKEFNYASFSEHRKLDKILEKVFSDLKEGMNIISPLPDIDVTLHLYIGKFEELGEQNIETDFFFHDPFSPEVNEELWTVSTFQILRSFAKEDAVLSTYCAASKARAAMAVAGWMLAKAQGALGKREMTIASLSEDKLTSYKRLNDQRLVERYNKGHFD